MHANGSFIYAQLWTLGRTADSKILKGEGVPFAAASDIPLKGREVPEPLNKSQIQDLIQLIGKAAYKAIHQSTLR